MQRFCKKCGIEKPLDDFYKQVGSKEGKRYECKSCTHKRNRAVYQKPETKNKKLAANKIHKENNKEYYETYSKNYYLKNKSKFSKNSQDRYASISGRSLALYNSSKRRAKKLNLEFDLSLARIEVSLMLGTCERTGLEFNLDPSDKTWRNPFAPSIDRIDSFKGYVNQNIKVVVNMYNYGKGQHTDDEFIRFCHAVARFNPIK